ncbi:MAG TPA: protease pro-enzyme activation domain-containing protein [Candidatus Solibacter sp.]|nr:protease pro-enzyme activation domain-containing protein [Candidatus Solibacter sp.]
MVNRRFWVGVCSLGMLAAAMVIAGPATKAQGRRRVDEGKRVVLRGNTRPEANAKNDRGAVSDNVRFEHMLLLLQRPPEVEQALVHYIDTLNDKNSPNYHLWLTAAEYGKKYGVAQEDVDTVTEWLGSKGLTVNKVYTNRVVIDFSGTAGQIHSAFGTSIHHLSVGGEHHVANMSDPQIPEALAPIVKGVFALHDFKPFAFHKAAADFTFAGCTGVTGPGKCYAVTPQDNQTIYNLTPLYAAGISGRGQTIVLLEDTDLYSIADWNTYRKIFGLARTYPYGTLAQIHPDCPAPGANGDDGEAAIDVEVASAIAPNAAIQLVACPSGDFTFGGLIAMQNMINDSATPPAIVSMSYGLCEATSGTAGNAGFYTTFQQAAAEGVSVFVSSGDELSSTCSNLFGIAEAVPGLGVTGWGETPYNVSVGGTDFADTFMHATSQYWNATNAANYGSAKSYIPETPWNDSCANLLITSYVAGPAAVPYGSTGFCNVTAGRPFLSPAGGSGGPSNCASGTGGVNQSNQVIVFGSCQGYPKPSWQAIYGNPADGVRDIPDISMFAANGLWGHYEVVCWSDPNFTSGGSKPCTGAPNTWSGFGGTSVSAPTMAAVQALVNQKTGQRWGNPNPIYYQMANAQFGADGSLAAACNSSAAGGPAAGCVFNDVTLGDIDVVCRSNGTITSNCYKPSGTNGVLSTNRVSSYVAGSTTASNPVIITGGSGYTSTPTCTIAAPSNSAPYVAPNGTTVYAGGTQATCTATFNPGSINAVGTIQAVQPLLSDGVGNDGFGVMVGATTYTFVVAFDGGANEIIEPPGTTAQQEARLAQNIAAAINANSALCFAAPCFSSDIVTPNASATATAAGTVVTLNATVPGYAGNFALDLVAGPVAPRLYLAVLGGNNGAGPGYVDNIIVADGGGSGYGPNSACTISGGGGSGAICVASTAPNTAVGSYQPAFGATPGWDFATGIGTPNAYNLVMNWPTGP